jgi:hypothetical protein
MNFVKDREFQLPPEVRPLSEARLAVRDYYRTKGLDLEFSFDGNLVGDFGEACAVEEYGMKLVEARSNAGFDGYAPNSEMTIQVKAKGPSTNQIAFSYSETQADHLLVIEFDFDRAVGVAIYNGPEHYVREFLPNEPWKGQKRVSLSQLRKAATRILDHERFPMRSLGASDMRTL